MIHCYIELVFVTVSTYPFSPAGNQITSSFVHLLLCRSTSNSVFSFQIGFETFQNLSKVYFLLSVYILSLSVFLPLFFRISSLPSRRFQRKSNSLSPLPHQACLHHRVNTLSRSNWGSGGQICSKHHTRSYGRYT
jgi:hypothetical protein